MISQTAEYALRIVVWLASQHPAPRTTREIAQATRIPAGYLAKVLQNLGRAHLVNSQRGLHGGFTLVREPSAISPLEVVNAIDPIRRLAGCPLGLEAHGTQLCPLHRKLDDAMAHIESALGTTMVSDLVESGPQAAPFCVGSEAGVKRRETP
jgi:Rrf2 family transcriptional regulator, nitric oxide-sensitive transcriptional repressor